MQAEKLENLIVPDSVQKEKFAQTVKRLAALDVNDIVSDIVSWLIWTGIKICIALAIYYAAMVHQAHSEYDRRDHDPPQDGAVAAYFPF